MLPTREGKELYVAVVRGGTADPADVFGFIFGFEPIAVPVSGSRINVRARAAIDKFNVAAGIFHIKADGKITVQIAGVRVRVEDPDLRDPAAEADMPFRVAQAPGVLDKDAPGTFRGRDRACFEACAAGMSKDQNVLTSVLKREILKLEIAIAALPGGDAFGHLGDMKVLDADAPGSLGDFKPSTALFFSREVIGHLAGTLQKNKAFAPQFF